MTAMNKAWTNIRGFAAEFGLSPSSRGRIEIPDGQADDDEDLD